MMMDPVGAELLHGSDLACLAKRERHWARECARDSGCMGEGYVLTEEIWVATSTTALRAMDPRELKTDREVAGNKEKVGNFLVAKT